MCIKLEYLVVYINCEIVYCVYIQSLLIQCESMTIFFEYLSV